MKDSTLQVGSKIKNQHLLMTEISRKDHKKAKSAKDVMFSISETSLEKLKSQRSKPIKTFSFCFLNFDLKKRSSRLIGTYSHWPRMTPPKSVAPARQNTRSDCLYVPLIEGVQGEAKR
jgi:hypothetical protein